MIEQLLVVVYPDEPGPSRTEVVNCPTLDGVIKNLRLMDRHSRPMLFLCKRAGDHGRDAMELTGGDGRYFIEATDDRGFWYTPYDASHGRERVAVWTSGEGSLVEAQYTWPFDDARAIAEHYFRSGGMHSAYDWKSVKQM